VFGADSVGQTEARDVDLSERGNVLELCPSLPDYRLANAMIEVEVVDTFCPSPVTACGLE
jgi:hypothetical protein